MTLLCLPNGDIACEFPGVFGDGRTIIPLRYPVRIRSYSDEIPVMTLVLSQITIESGNVRHPDGRLERAARLLSASDVDAVKSWILAHL